MNTILEYLCVSKKILKHGWNSNPFVMSFELLIKTNNMFACIVNIVHKA